MFVCHLRFRLDTALCILTLVAGSLAACHKPEPSPNPEDPIIAPSDLSAPGVTGVVAQAPALIIVGDLSTAPAGATAVGGATVTARDVQGKLLAQAITADDGGFTLSPLPPGFVRIEAASMKQAAPAVVNATVIPGFTLQLAAASNTTREQASALALAGLPDTALVGGAMNPFPAGTVLYPPLRADGAVPLNADALTLAANTWVFLVDRTPLLDHGHPVEYVLVDAATGAVNRMGAQYPLFINHARLWRSSDKWFTFSPPAGRLDPADLPPDASALPSPELVQVPRIENNPNPPDSVIEFPAPLNNELFDEIAANNPFDKDYPYASPFPDKDHFNNGNDGVFAVLVRCGEENHFGQNVNRVTNHLVYDGVPQGNIGIADFTRNPAPVVNTAGLSGPDASRAREAAINAMIQKAVLVFEPQIQIRLSLGQHSTLIVYLSGHGGGGSMIVDFADQVGNWTFNAKGMGITQTLACRVRVIVQSCEAEDFTNDLATAFAPTEHDVKLFAASAASKKATATPGFVTYVPVLNLLIQGGSHFTTRFVRTMTIDQGEITDVTEIDDTGKEVLVEDLAELNGAPPAPFVRPFHPYWCFPSVEGEGEADIALEGEGDGQEGSQDGVAEGEPDGQMEGEGEGQPDGSADGEGDGQPEGNVEGEGEGQAGALDDAAYLLEKICGAELAAAALENADALPTGIPRPLPTEVTGVTVPGDTVEITHRVIALKALTAQEAELLFSRSTTTPGDFSCTTENTLAFTACPLSSAAFVDGDWVFIATVLQAPVPLDDLSVRHQYFFLFDSDNDPSNDWQVSETYPSDEYQGTDKWYVISSTNTGWHLTVNQHFSDDEIDFARSAARVIVRGNTVLLAVPLNEFPSAVPRIRQVALTEASATEPRSTDFHPELNELLQVVE